MKAKALTFDEVREIGLALPRTKKSTAWGTPVLKVDGRIFAGIPIHKSAEPGSVMLSVDAASRDAMIEEQPDIYYTAAHYENYSVVLVRLARINRDVLEDLVRMSHRFVSARTKKRPRVTKARRATKFTKRSRT